MTMKVTEVVLDDSNSFSLPLFLSLVSFSFSFSVFLLAAADSSVAAAYQQAFVCALRFLALRLLLFSLWLQH